MPELLRSLRLIRIFKNKREREMDTKLELQIYQRLMSMLSDNWMQF
jgi:hypothetical protein